MKNKELIKVLSNLLVIKLTDTKECLIYYIKNPENIEDTNSFSELLGVLLFPEFIDPLLQKIADSNANDKWLVDYLFALVTILDETDDTESFEIPENLLKKLESWTLNNSGELALMSVNLLAYYDQEDAEPILLKKLKQDDFFMTHISCIRSLLCFDRIKYLDIVRIIVNDESKDEKLKDFCKAALEEYEN